MFTNLENTLRLTLLMLFTLLMSHSSYAVQPLEKLYTLPGYPYEPLVRRAERVAIAFKQEGNMVRCRTEISQHDTHWTGKPRLVGQEAFNEAPLRSCLNRSDAKKLLKKSYQ
ncbi:hypothetical protein FX988_01731 [Paraglaciecola mesophila]|uniref:Uncharacterized protein n=1 Tax=Paraglaciecola mesophila TaxID=197222 RepID=A0A857JKJ8_9ALTE|nr:hypothetical protein [Paraglaciecola mesophila]QHJ11497.1 hypothetical protein FX988_01731 [Paraglaciecola mesophila]